MVNNTTDHIVKLFSDKNSNRKHVFIYVNVYVYANIYNVYLAKKIVLFIRLRQVKCIFHSYFAFRTFFV